MIHQFVNRFQSLDRDIEALSYVLLTFILIISARVSFFVYECRYEELWPLLASATPLFAALLVARVSSRVIANGNIIRADDRRQDVVRTTHHLIAISQDLRARVGYVKIMLSVGDHPAFALSQIAATIEDRYETLLEREAYKFLPGTCVDNIVQMSGDIFGVRMFAEGMKQIAAADPVSVLKSLPTNANQVIVASLDRLMADLQELIDELFTLRASVEGVDK